MMNILLCIHALHTYEHKCTQTSSAVQFHPTSLLSSLSFSDPDRYRSFNTLRKMCVWSCAFCVAQTIKRKSGTERGKLCIRMMNKSICTIVVMPLLMLSMLV